MVMEWRNMKMLMVSTVTVLVVSQVVKKVYSFCSEKIKSRKKSLRPDCVDNKSEIHDVILYDNKEVQLTSDSDYLKIRKDPPCPKDKKLISYIRSAKETLDICMYLITNQEMVDHIIRLGRKQVLVRLIVDEEMSLKNTTQIKRLKQYSFIRVQHSNDTSLSQHKFCVIDGPTAVKRKCRLITNAQKLHKDVLYQTKPDKPKAIKAVIPFIMTGSLDWTCPGLIDTNNNVIITSQPLIVHKFEKEYTRLWHENEYNVSKKNKHSRM